MSGLRADIDKDETFARREGCCIAKERNTIKTLFLDFDGVLHPNFCSECDWFRLAPALVECIHKHRMNIVISSSWRFQFKLNDLLSQLPPELAKRVIGTTGDAQAGDCARFQEITQYIDRHAVNDWRALDDSAFEFPSGYPQLILCDGRHGIRENDLKALNNWLQG